MPRIAINYRRDDTSPWAGRLFDRLSAEFGREHVFMDIDHLEPGVDFAEEINRAITQSQVLVVMIGPDWATVKDSKGNRRLDSGMDFVRLEIAAALLGNLRVIPILVGGAVMPALEELPEDLKPLARRHAIEISDLRFHADVDRLIRSLRLQSDGQPSATGKKVALAELPELEAEGAPGAPKQPTVLGPGVDSGPLFPGWWQADVEIVGMGQATYDIELRTNGQIRGEGWVQPVGFIGEMGEQHGFANLLNRRFPVEGEWTYEDSADQLTLTMTATGFGLVKTETISILAIGRERG